MPKGLLLLATFGLALNLILWSVPGMVAAGSAVRFIAPEANRGPMQTNQQRHNLLDALVVLIGAESEALQVAGDALQQPTPPDLAPRANAAGDRVEDAVKTYIRTAEAVVGR